MANSGALDQRVTFQDVSEVSDGMGGATRTWVNLVTTPTVWAAVKTFANREAFDEGGNTATASTRFTIRYREDVNETHRIQWRGEAYNIRAVKRSSQRELFLEIEAERGAAT